MHSFSSCSVIVGEGKIAAYTHTHTHTQRQGPHGVPIPGEINVNGHILSDVDLWSEEDKVG